MSLSPNDEIFTITSKIDRAAHVEGTYGSALLVMLA
jgi:hypothetical protein